MPRAVHADYRYPPGCFSRTRTGSAPIRIQAHPMQRSVRSVHDFLREHQERWEAEDRERASMLKEDAGSRKRQRMQEKQEAERVRTELHSQWRETEAMAKEDEYAWNVRDQKRYRWRPPAPPRSR